MKSKLINIGSILFLSILTIVAFKIDINEKEEMKIVPDTLNLSLLDLNKDNFYFVCHYYEIDYPEIVYAQAQLESGRFTSNVFKTRNNFLGLYNSNKKEYYNFTHWSDCLKGYKNSVQYKWDGNEDYYTFLQKLPYAEDPRYIYKIKRLVNDCPREKRKQLRKDAANFVNNYFKYRSKLVKDAVYDTYLMIVKDKILF